MAQTNQGEAWYDSITIDADFAKFAASCVIAAVFLLGFTYSNEYFKSFGLSLAEIDLSYAHIIGHGVYMFRDWPVFFGSLGVIGILSTVFSLARRFLSRFVFFLSVGLLFLAICYLAVCVGSYKGKSHSTLITNGEAGKVAYCVLRDDAYFKKDFKENFQAWTLAGEVRKVYETNFTIYLSTVLKEIPEGFHGQTFAISKSDIAYCRVLGQ